MGIGDYTTFIKMDKENAYVLYQDRTIRIYYLT